MKAKAAEQEAWLLFDQNECWFSQFAKPKALAWAEPGQERHFVQCTPAPQEPEKVLACFGAVRQDTQKTVLYFTASQPNREMMWLFIMALLALARQEMKQVVVLLWDNATWHKSARLREWLHTYNQAAKWAGEPRLLTWLLP